MALADLGDLLGADAHALDLGGLVGAAHPALDAHVGAPAGLVPGSASVTSPRASRIQGGCGSSEVTTISPTSPGATGSPVPGLTISRIRSSFTTMPSRASVSNAIRPRSAVPKAW